MAFTPVATTDTLETFRTRYNATNITLVDDSSSSVDITLATDSLKISGGTGTASVISGDTLTLNLSNTGVSAGTVGSSTAIPVLAINAQGQITSASTASISTDLTVIDDASTSATISLASDSFKISGGTGTTSAISGDTLTINLDNTAVSAGSYGSSTAIPVLTVDAQGRLTSASTASVSTDLTIIDDSSTSATISLGSDTLKFAGGAGVTTSISGDVVTFASSATAAFTDFIYTATSGQTTFSGADDNGNTLAYAAASLDVFLNGVLLDDSDYTATDTTSVVLSSAAAASDILTGKAWNVNNVSSFDLNGTELVLDVDGDTSITADTDDQIDFKLGGTDSVSMTPSQVTLTDADSSQPKLLLKNTNADATSAYLDFQKDSASPASNDELGNIRFIGDDDGGNQTTFAAITGYASNPTDGNENSVISFQTAVAGTLAERLKINSSGLVEINSIYNSTAVLSVKSAGAFGGAGTGIVLETRSTTPANNDEMGTLTFQGNNSVQDNTMFSQIFVKATDVTDGAEDSIMQFYLRNNGSYNENMRLEEDGDLHVDGNVVAYSTTVSDVALKSDIEVIPNALDKLDEIRGVTFTRHNGKQSAGIIAQELEKVLPEAINETELPLQKDDNKKYKTVEYDAIHGLLIQAIKELKDELRELKS